jgi:hypothetical protein
MHAFANNQVTWTLVGLTATLAVWLATRAWSRRARSPATAALRARLTDGTLSPRAHHYYFAHAALKELAFEDPERLVIAMAAPEAETFLVEMWQAVGKDVAAMGAQQEQPQPQEQGGDAEASSSSSEIVPPDGLEAIPARVAGRPTALVRLPEPRATTEAYFVAVVLNHELAEPVKPAPEVEVFYFTLEKGFSMDGSLRTVFCEWDASTHKNYGDGPPADARLFLDHIAAHLSARAAPAPQASFHPGEPKARE